MPTITIADAGSSDVLKFLDTIAFTEGTATDPLTKNNGYDVIVNGVGGPEIFTDYSTHPFANGRPAKIVRPAENGKPALTSTASGRYQLLARYFIAYKKQLNLPDFSPRSQDLIALQQMKERGSLVHLRSGSIEKAIAAHITPVDLYDAVMEDASVWASLPGNSYGQGGKSMEQILDHWKTLQV